MTAPIRTPTARQPHRTPSRPHADPSPRRPDRTPTRSHVRAYCRYFFCAPQRARDRKGVEKHQVVLTQPALALPAITRLTLARLTLAQPMLVGLSLARPTLVERDNPNHTCPHLATCHAHRTPHAEASAWLPPDARRRPDLPACGAACGKGRERGSLRAPIAIYCYLLSPAIYYPPLYTTSTHEGSRLGGVSEHRPPHQLACCCRR